MKLAQYIEGIDREVMRSLEAAAGEEAARVYDGLVKHHEDTVKTTVPIRKVFFYKISIKHTQFSAIEKLYCFITIKISQE